MTPDLRISSAEREVPPDRWPLRRATSGADLARIAGLGVYVAALVFVMGRYGIPNEREQVLAWTLGFVVAVSVVVGALWSRAARAVRDWSVFGVLLVIYDYSRGVADWFGMPLQIDAPIIIDRVMFPGDVPTVELQARMGPFLGQRWWEAAMALVYATHFFAPYVVTAVLWLTDRGRWRAWLTQYIAITAVGLLGYVTLSTMPPWLASRTGTPWRSRAGNHAGLATTPSRRSRRDHRQGPGRCQPRGSLPLIARRVPRPHRRVLLATGPLQPGATAPGGLSTGDGPDTRDRRRALRHRHPRRLGYRRRHHRSGNSPRPTPAAI